MSNPFIHLTLVALLWSPIVAADMSKADGRGGVVWETGSFDEAVVRARQSGRWLVVDFFTTWCGPCHEMDERVFSSVEVQNAVGPLFVMLKRDAEQGEGAALAARFNIVGFPTLLVLAPGVEASQPAQEVDRVMGFVPAGSLITTLEHYRQGKGTLADLEVRNQKAPDPQLYFEIGMRHALRGDSRAIQELGSFSGTGSLNEKNAERRAATALLTLGKYYYLRSTKNYARAEAVLKELRERFPKTEEAQEQAPYALAQAIWKQGRGPEARQILDKWLEACAQTPNACSDGSRHNAYAWFCFKEGFERARGIEVARRGLELAPSEHGLWDTLAELYAANGKLAEAKNAEQRALQLKPESRYYAAQLKRWSEPKK